MLADQSETDQCRYTLVTGVCPYLVKKNSGDIYIPIIILLNLILKRSLEAIDDDGFKVVIT